MLLIRSLFWLTAAFIVIKPAAEIETAAADLSAGAMAAGQRLIVEQIARTECESLGCAGGKAALAAILAPDPAPSVAPAPVPKPPIPVPRPRPDWAG